jgi:hypothetical protein
MFYMDQVTLKAVLYCGAIYAVISTSLVICLALFTHEDLSSSSFKEHSLGRANQAAFFSFQGS